MPVVNANSVDPAASDLSLHSSLPVSHLWDARHKRVEKQISSSSGLLSNKSLFRDQL